MGKITILTDTTPKNPITLIGRRAGICWGADISDDNKNYKRGLSCLKDNHGRTFEFPCVDLIIDGYSSRVIREWYTHIGGSPTRLQESTRYVDCENFDYVIPRSILVSEFSTDVYVEAMNKIKESYRTLKLMNIPKEDIANILPLGMTTKIVDHRNLRNYIDMMANRKCNRAYWEFRELVNDICKALSSYSEEWKYLVDNYFTAKCDRIGYCTESRGCGKYPHKQKDNTVK